MCDGKCPDTVPEWHKGNLVTLIYISVWPKKMKVGNDVVAPFQSVPIMKKKICAKNLFNWPMFMGGPRPLKF